MFGEADEFTFQFGDFTIACFMYKEFIEYQFTFQFGDFTIAKLIDPKFFNEKIYIPIW